MEWGHFTCEYTDTFCGCIILGGVYNIFKAGSYISCDFVACNKSHAINRVVYHRYSRRFLSGEINRME